MCGISGFIGVNPLKRMHLVVGLGWGIDERGGHASGYVSLGDGVTRVRHRIGSWQDASPFFLADAADSSICMMHARWATCGDRRDVKQAHPYTIKRNKRTVLYGAHNGILWGADESAERNGREYTVDSKEFFELLADNQIDQIQNLEGYGVATWMEPGKNYVNLVRLSQDSEIVAVGLEDGGTVWASTDEILRVALEAAKLEVKGYYPLDEIGTVYQIHDDAVVETKRTGIRVESMISTWGSGSYGSGWGNYDSEEFPPFFQKSENEWDDNDREAFQRWMHAPENQ